jgi:hypothetical protein
VEHQGNGDQIVDIFLFDCLFIVFLQIINDDEKRNHKSNSKRLAKMTWVAKFWGKNLKNTLPTDWLSAQLAILTS